MVVRIGPKAAGYLALALLVAAVASAFTLLLVTAALPSVPVNVLLGAHLTLLFFLLGRFCLFEGDCRRIDAILALSLAAILWFSLYPLLNLRTLL
jgi:hypothetical protein